VEYIKVINCINKYLSVAFDEEIKKNIYLQNSIYSSQLKEPMIFSVESIYMHHARTLDSE